MSKDPAVLFYTSDFLTGTSFFTNEQKGQYITLLCQQHQLGVIPENHMISVCGSIDSPVIKKFEIDEDGNYFNSRMRIESERRRKYCDSRSNNKSGRPKKQTSKKSYDKSCDIDMNIHMETETENDNINNNIIVTDFENLKEALNNSEIWLQELAMLYHYETSEEVKELLNIFLSEQKTDDNIFRPLKEIKRHFRNTLKKQKTNGNKQHTNPSWEAIKELK